jgi:hypothetical protein
MRTANKGPQFPSLIDYVIEQAKARGLVKKTIDTYYDDANCVLEALVASYDESAVAEAVAEQGLKGNYGTLIGRLCKESRRRRVQRRKNSN